MNIKHTTLEAWMKDIASRDFSDIDDEKIMKYAFISFKIPFKAITGGLVYSCNGEIVPLQKAAQTLVEVLVEADLMNNKVRA